MECRETSPCEIAGDSLGGIGEIATLGLIDLVECTDSAAISAMGILAEQESLGYED